MTQNFMAAAQALSGGVLIGLASWLLLASLGRIAGISGITATAIAPSDAEKAEPAGWRWAFLAGLVLGGALFTSWLAPPLIATRPWLVLVGAGLLVGVGTVVGSGCTSGHGVCGLGRRSGRSLIATLTFMAFGVATVLVVHWLSGRSLF